MWQANRHQEYSRHLCDSYKWSRERGWGMAEAMRRRFRRRDRPSPWGWWEEAHSNYHFSVEKGEFLVGEQSVLTKGWVLPVSMCCWFSEARSLGAKLDSCLSSHLDGEETDQVFAHLKYIIYPQHVHEKEGNFSLKKKKTRQYQQYQVLPRMRGRWDSHRLKVWGWKMLHLFAKRLNHFL